MSAQPTTALTDPLLELRPQRAVPLAPSIIRARASFAATVDDMLRVPDAALEGAWRWRPDDELDADVRYGLYRIVEVLEDAVARIARGRAVGDKRQPMAPAVPRLAAATAARWGLHGALAGLRVADWDGDPGGSEWSVRRTMGHIVTSQRAYGWYTAWYLSRAGSPDAGNVPPEGTFPPDPDEEVEGQGAPGEVVERLDALLDTATERFANLDDAALQAPGRWSGLPVTVDFRLGRLASHVREHTIQVDKTVAMVGRERTEVERVTRLACDAYGRLEATVFGHPKADIEARFDDGANAGAVLEETATEVARLAASVRAAAATG